MEKNRTHTMRAECRRGPGSIQTLFCFEHFFPFQVPIQRCNAIHTLSSSESAEVDPLCHPVMPRWALANYPHQTRRSLLPQLVLLKALSGPIPPYGVSCCVYHRVSSGQASHNRSHVTGRLQWRRQLRYRCGPSSEPPSLGSRWHCGTMPDCAA